VARSQEKLGELVEIELKDIDRSFQISPERVRRIALEIPGIDVKVETRKSRGKRPDKCPVCSKELDSLYAENLDGERIQVGFKCSSCGYRGEIEEFDPMRYEFVLTKG